MNKAFFKDHLEKSMAEVEVDHTFKNELAEKLFSPQKGKKHFWTWTKAIFTTPVFAAIVLILILNSSKETIIFSQQALAQAIDNTFDFDHFETTFGLPNDGKFYHRVLTYHNYGDDTPIVGAYAETMSLWTDSENIRSDVKFEPEHKEFTEFRSFLINPAAGLKCELALFKECELIETLKKQYVLTFSSGLDTHYPVAQENLLQNLDINTFYDSTKGNIYQLSWSTKKPLNGAAVIWSNDPAAGGTVIALNSVNEDYTNKFEQGEYWHLVSIPMDPRIDGGSVYFQIETDHFLGELELEEKDLTPRNERLHSMIYALDKNQEISPVSIENFVSYLQNKYLLWPASDDSFKANFRSIIFALKNDTYSKNSIFLKNIERNEKSIIQIRYQLPSSYSKIFYMPDEGEHEYFIDVFLNENQTRFLGYSLIKDEAELESLWIEDEVLPDGKKPQLFDKSAWMESIKAEEKAKKYEQEEWLKASGQQRPPETQTSE